MENLFFALKKNLNWTASKAIELKCRNEAPASSECSIINIGQSMVRTIDPLLQSNSLYCVDSSGKKASLNPLEEYDPNKMYPKTVELKAGESYLFHTQSCAGRIVMKTSDMLVNKNYADLLLGETVANGLNP